MKIYLVSSGEYSDYSIDAAFSTEEKANAYAILEDDRNVEEYEIDEVIIPEYVGVYVYSGDCKYSMTDRISEHVPQREVEYDEGRYHVKVKYNSNKDVMMKSAYDKISEYKATKAGIS